MLLLILAVLIAAATLWYTNYIASKIEKEERKQIEMWSEAIVSRAQLVQFADKLFDQLKEEERVDADFLVKGFLILNDPGSAEDLTFVTEFLFSNTTIPLLIYNKEDSLVLAKNLIPGKSKNQVYIDSLRYEMETKNKPIVFSEVGHSVYYDDSYIFQELKDIMDDLIESFVSETVMNSASIPVILTDSLRSQVVNSQNIDVSELNDSIALNVKLKEMTLENKPIEFELSGSGKQFIYYQDSDILKKLKYFPFFQLILIGVFLLGSYLIFSTYRKAEQNQVWVGMAKETAHQLGTPLSSLMAWVTILGDMGVDKSTIVEINKDVERLETITDRFSKIGSTPELKRENVVEVMNKSISYLSSRVSSKVIFEVNADGDQYFADLNVPLFGWVLENLVKNATDAMAGKGNLTTHIFEQGQHIVIDISDTGKGMTKANFRNVFQPGFTTKKRGWGLGLSLAKRIIEIYHEGKISVKDSEIDKGTTFRIMLNKSK